MKEIYMIKHLSDCQKYSGKLNLQLPKNRDADFFVKFDKQFREKMASIILFG